MPKSYFFDGLKVPDVQNWIRCIKMMQSEMGNVFGRLKCIENIILFCICRAPRESGDEGCKGLEGNEG